MHSKNTQLADTEHLSDKRDTLHTQLAEHFEAVCQHKGIETLAG